MQLMLGASSTIIHGTPPDGMVCNVCVIHGTPPDGMACNVSRHISTHGMYRYIVVVCLQNGIP